jgi:hypothetical protein
LSRPVARKGKRQIAYGAAARVRSSALAGAPPEDFGSHAPLGESFEFDGVPADDEHDHDPEWLPTFAEAFPTPAAAVRAVRAGRSAAAWLSFEEAEHRIVVEADADAAVCVRQVYLPRLAIGDLVRTVLLNSGFDGRPEHESVAAVLRALGGYGAAVGVAAQLEPFAEPGGGLFPRFGWRHRAPLDESGSWAEAFATPTAVARLERERLTDVWCRRPGRASNGTLEAEYRRWDMLLETLRGEALSVHTCARCGEPVTNRHPDWPGLWITLSVDGELATCPEVRPSFEKQYARGAKAYDTVLMAGPHVPDPAPGAEPSA